MAPTLARTALTGAVLTSGLALADAVWQATAATPAPWTPGEGVEAVARAGDGLHGVTYLLLAAVLIRCAAQIDAGRAAVRWLRRVLAVDLVLLGVPFLFSAATGATGGDGPVGAVAGVAFLGLFVLSAVLGMVLLARAETRRPAAWLLAAPLALVPLMLLAGAVGWAHPGYAETAVYLGVAILGLPAAATTRVARPRETASA